MFDELELYAQLITGASRLNGIGIAVPATAATVTTKPAVLSIAPSCQHLTEVVALHNVVSATAPRTVAVRVGAALPKFKPMRVRVDPPKAALGAHASVSTAESNVKAKLELPAETAAQI